MGDYSITLTRSARKELESFDEPLVLRIFLKIESLAKEPRPKGCVKLKGNNHLWRIRIEDYRVIYSIDDFNTALDVIAIRHRSKVYR
ncbi:MAG: type II toxin-antitoxin system RelE/ParE family toxin [Nitrospirae bacterium]|nr:type II toxin-antitoxin system RelE/ParE family toxin [Nitrospirota bacterium]MBF0616637.1 type II toxin-antitoxin system RelE/ParE family toxin [Nitrospirota bacterium]